MPSQVENFTIRGNYPNLYSRFADADDKYSKKELPGFQPAQLEYWLKDSNETIEVPIRGVDIPQLNHPDAEKGRHYLSLLIRARAGDSIAREQMDTLLKQEKDENNRFCDELTLVESPQVVPSFTTSEYRKEEVSHKGLNLIHLSQQGFPVPDFCILTANSYQSSARDRSTHFKQALQNLESMTEREVGSAAHPLIFAMRYAMPSYIPGLLPTYLNVGVTEEIFPTLCQIYGENPGRKMYFNNLKNLRQLLSLDHPPISAATRAVMDNPTDLELAIEILAEEIRALDSRLLTDAFAQAIYLDQHSHRFFEENLDLIFTLSHGRSVLPALIMQVMICTVRGQRSYPGVLHSRNPNTGRKRMVETVFNIFGEDIMTGTVQAQVKDFADRREIKADFPALYHFEPSLEILEKDFASQVTTEFAAESVRCGHFFALLQINDTELTGRAALVSSMDMHHEGILPKQKVPSLVRPFHFRQIMSDTISEDDIELLEFFSDGFAILPRSAISAKVYFSAHRALEAKNRGESSVCLCQESFLPSDAVTLGKMDMILSLTPAAIHLITTCRGQGILAVLDLESYGVQLDNKGEMTNHAGLKIEEGDWITVSSKRKKIYKGKAHFTPARFNKFRQGEKLDLEPREKEVFQTLENAFSQYHELVHSLKADQVESYQDLVKLVLTDLADDPAQAREIVNRWLDFFPDEYLNAILSCDLGSHRKHSEVYGFLSQAQQVRFFHKVVDRCLDLDLCGMSAGSFMIGRFLQVPHGVTFWNQLSDKEIGFVLNEWVHYRKYRQVLMEVGEHHIARARKILLDGPDRPLKIDLVDGKSFMILKLSRKNILNIEKGLGEDAFTETAELLQMLAKPFSFFYDYRQKWSINPLRKICEQEGIALPEPNET